MVKPLLQAPSLAFDSTQWLHKGYCVAEWALLDLDNEILGSSRTDPRAAFLVLDLEFFSSFSVCQNCGFSPSWSLVWLPLTVSSGR